MEASDHSEAAADVMRQASELPGMDHTGPPAHGEMPQGASFNEQVLDQLSEIGVRTAHIESSVEALVHNLEGVTKDELERVICLCVEREVGKLKKDIIQALDAQTNETKDPS